MHSVGQILYCILEKKKIIIPVRVVEEITIKKIDFEKTSFKVQLPNTKDETVDLEKFDNFFDDIEEASNYLIDNAKRAIEDISLKALDLEEKFFSTKTKEEELVEKSLDDLECNNEDEKIKIDLGDGTKATISASSIESLNLNN
tara:strand:- start:618 stop:1049 length:432 start_codon:yes stop_codon:yes gene_type:complete